MSNRMNLKRMTLQKNHPLMVSQWTQAMSLLFSVCPMSLVSITLHGLLHRLVSLLYMYHLGDTIEGGASAGSHPASASISRSSTPGQYYIFHIPDIYLTIT